VRHYYDGRRRYIYGPYIEGPIDGIDSVRFFGRLGAGKSEIDDIMTLKAAATRTMIRNLKQRQTVVGLNLLLVEGFETAATVLQKRTACIAQASDCGVFDCSFGASDFCG
jgi:hypothetical protein